MADVAARKERKIMVAVDESEESTHALSWCLKNLISSHPNDTLLLLYVKPSRAAAYTSLDGTGMRDQYLRQGYLFSSDVMATMEKYSAHVADCIMEKAKKMCSEEAKDVKVEMIVEHGDPRDVICVMAEKLCADILVMGSHGYGLIKRALLGSVSNHCAQNVKCPVLIVKKPKSSGSGSK